MLAIASFPGLPAGDVDMHVQKGHARVSVYVSAPTRVCRLCYCVVYPIVAVEAIITL